MSLRVILQRAYDLRFILQSLQIAHCITVHRHSRQKPWIQGDEFNPRPAVLITPSSFELEFDSELHVVGTYVRNTAIHNVIGKIDKAY